LHQKIIYNTNNNQVKIKYSDGAPESSIQILDVGAADNIDDELDENIWTSNYLYGMVNLIISYAS
jgi:hypothetical protein